MSAILDRIVEEFRSLEPEEQGQLLEILEREKHGSELRRLASEQGVQPFEFEQVRRDFWPQEESADDFLSWLRSQREEGGAHRSLPE
jgi:hypothetical protein